MMLVGVALVVVGSATVWRMARLDVPFRAGPWPGLSPAGAVVLLGCALLLAGGQLALGDPRSPLPDLPLLAVLVVCPLALATRLVQAPGAASAVCGVYLLPRTLLSLFDPGIEPPPLLLVPALAFDVTAWLRASDLSSLRDVWPGRRSAWRRRRPRPAGQTKARVTADVTDVTGPAAGVCGVTDVTGATAGLSGVTHHVTVGVTPRFYAGGRRRGMVGPRRRSGRGRAAGAGAVFGAVLATIEPPFAVLLGADPAAWSGANLWLAGDLATLGCAIAALAVLSARAARR